MRVLTANEFTLTCTLDLDEYSGAVCVDERQCAFELHAGEWWLWKPPPSSDLPRVPARQLGVAFRDMYESNQESIEFAARP